MKKPLSALIAFLLLSLIEQRPLFADTLYFTNGRTLSGSVLQTNDDQVLWLAGCAAINFSTASIKEITLQRGDPDQLSNTDRLPSFEKTIINLSKQPWATKLKPIPATVIDKGILRNVPYSSFRCADDYEINVYGDPDHPAGVEIGIYRNLLGDKTAKYNCLNFMGSLLNLSADREIIKKLDLKKDLQTSENLTFEITPPTADDAFGGWWISVYSEQQLNLARATDAEMNQITVSKSDAVHPTAPTDTQTAWSPGDIKLARPSTPDTFTFTNQSGDVITNAEVVRVFVPGVSLIWRSGTREGMVRLADLPEDLRGHFGYDPVKTAAADETEREKRQQRALAAQNQAVAQAQAGMAPYSDGYSQFGGAGSSASSGGSVYVRGYYRSNGTYVNGYTRR